MDKLAHESGLTDAWAERCEVSWRIPGLLQPNRSASCRHQGTEDAMEDERDVVIKPGIVLSKTVIFNEQSTTSSAFPTTTAKHPRPSAAHPLKSPSNHVETPRPQQTRPPHPRRRRP